MKNKIKYIILFITLFVGFYGTSQAQIAVIANKSVNEKITRQKLIDIYLLNKQYWEDGSKIVLYDIKGDRSIKDKFYSTLGMSRQQIQKTWLKKQFSGQADPPKTFRTQEEIIKYVANTPGAIAYISLDKVSDSVKILAKIK